MNGPANTVAEKYLGDGNSEGKKDGLGVGVGVLTGVETAQSAQGAGTTRHVSISKQTSSAEVSEALGSSATGTGMSTSASSSVSAGIAGLREGIAGLGVALSKGGSGSKSPARSEKQALEVEMQ
jgi:hypothetical protein